MNTECNTSRELFPELIRKKVSVDFQGGYVSSDGGGILLARTDRSTGHVKRFCDSFTDHRKSELIEHSLLDLIRQRVYGLALGYEDLNDHEQLKGDPLFATLCGKKDPLGKSRSRAKDLGTPLAGKSTLNRLELTPADANGNHRYKKIVGDQQAIENFFIEEYVRSLKQSTRRIVLDLDATDDPLHGNQEGRFFHGYYRHYCYLPLYIFDGHWPILARLRVSKIDAAAGATEAVMKIVQAIRKKLPEVKILLRADSGFCRDELMRWCESNGVFYLFGMARNPVLQRRLASTMQAAQELAEKSPDGYARLFYSFKYKAQNWPGDLRRLIGKAEHNVLGANPRFIITNLKGQGRYLYEQLYCARGEMENRIKEQQLDLFADRTSTGTLRSNQLRLWLSTLAYLLIHRVRQIALKGTPLARASCGSVRLKIFKIGALVKVSTRRVTVSLSSTYPWKEIFFRAARKLTPGPAG